MTESPERLTRTVTKTYLDMETGEQRRMATEEPIKKRPPGKGKSVEPFGLWFPAGLVRLAQMDLTGNDLRVLMLIAGWSDFEEHTGYSPTDIGNKLGMRRQNVSRSVAHLKELGVLIPGGGPRRVWINPEFFWRGSVLGRMKLLHTLQQDKKSKAAAPQEEST